MKKKGMLLFVILFTLVFAILVSLKFFDRNKLVQLNAEFSLEKNQLVKVANRDYTNIKLVSITDTCDDSICAFDEKLEYKLIVNGKEHTITNIPTKIDIYEKAQLEVLDGDEDRLVLKVTEK